MFDSDSEFDFDFDVDFDKKHVKEINVEEDLKEKIYYFEDLLEKYKDDYENARGRKKVYNGSDDDYMYELEEDQEEADRIYFEKYKQYAPKIIEYMDKLRELGVKDLPKLRGVYIVFW